jgi:hypothetical protein
MAFFVNFKALFFFCSKKRLKNVFRVTFLNANTSVSYTDFNRQEQIWISWTLVLHANNNFWWVVREFYRIPNQVD